MSSLDMLATRPLLASMTTLYSALGALKMYVQATSKRQVEGHLTDGRAAAH